MPHEFLNLDVAELTLAVICMGHGQAYAAQLASRIVQGGGMVFPTMGVGRG